MPHLPSKECDMSTFLLQKMHCSRSLSNGAAVDFAACTGPAIRVVLNAGPDILDEPVVLKHMEVHLQPIGVLQCLLAPVDIYRPLAHLVVRVAPVEMFRK